MDGEVKIAYERKPLSVVGDGKKNIEELFNKKINLLKKSREIDVLFSDKRIGERLKNYYRVSKKFVPKIGQEIILLDNANLSSGGEGIDATGIIHDDYKKLAVGIAKSMNLELAGVDLLVPGDITKPLDNRRDTPTCLEVNSSPGLNHYQTLGKEAEKRVENLYREILLKLRSR